MSAPIRTGAPDEPRQKPHKPLDLLPRSQFHWTGQDISDAGLLACMLGVIRCVALGEAIIETAAELEDRPPRIMDAWRFFHAASLLEDHPSLIGQAARARQMGCRIALAVTGWIVTDCVLVEAGASAGFGMFVRGQDRPCVVNIDPDGRTCFEPDYRHDGDATGTPDGSGYIIANEADGGESRAARRLKQQAPDAPPAGLFDFPLPMGAK